MQTEDKTGFSNWIMQGRSFIQSVLHRVVQKKTNNRKGARIMARKKPNIIGVRGLKATDYKITALTAYDYWQAKMADMAEIDVVVVNDIAYACLECGQFPNGRQTTIEEIIHATKNVKRGSGECFVVVSMPFGTYTTPEDGLKNAIAIYKATDCDALHVEGGRPDVIAEITKNGIPVLGHIGVTKVNIAATGATKLTGNTPEKADELLMEARALEAAGCFALVLECMPTQTAKRITESIGICTVGIGAGIECNGQFLVTDDMLGMLPDFNPKFVKRYANTRDYIVNAFKSFARDVREGVYPSAEYSYGHPSGSRQSGMGLPMVPNGPAAPMAREYSYSSYSAPSSGSQDRFSLPVVPNQSSVSCGNVSNTTVLGRPTWAEINIDSIINNVREFRRAVGPDVSIMIAHKAHGYGHGHLPIARALDHEDIWGFVTGNINEAIEMRQAGIRKPIQLFAHNFPDTAHLLKEYDLRPSFVNVGDAKAFSEALGRHVPMKVWVKVDTGLGRLGLFPDQVLNELRYIRDHTAFEIDGLYSHIGPVDAPGFDKQEYNRRQVQLYENIVAAVKADGFKIPHYQFASSFATQAFKSMHFNTVCIGHSVYSITKPSSDPEFKLNLKNALEGLRSRLITVKAFKKGTRTLNMLHEKDEVIGVVPFGVGDGYNTKNNGGVALVNGQRCKILGVCLEHTVLDLTGVSNPRIGDVVTFIGKDGDYEVTLQDCMARTGMSVLEYVCSLNFTSFPHFYLKDGRVTASGIYRDCL